MTARLQQVVQDRVATGAVPGASALVGRGDEVESAAAGELQSRAGRPGRAPVA